MGTLLLASKLTENIRRVRDIVNVTFFLYSTNSIPNDQYVYVCDEGESKQTPLLDYIGKEYYEWRDKATFAEAVVLREVGFELEVNLPYGLLINYAKVLDLIEHQSLMSKALGYMNDSFRTPANILFQPNVVACASILLACRHAGHFLPTNWYVVFDADTESIECVCRLVHSLYVVSLPSTRPILSV